MVGGAEYPIATVGSAAEHMHFYWLSLELLDLVHYKLSVYVASYHNARKCSKMLSDKGQWTGIPSSKGA